ncbi:MAG: hypothetical protein ACRBI6_22835 [Acidimicrobiales bacterium]
MFLITCPGCSSPHLAAQSDVLSMHRTSEGLIGYIRCHDSGATVVHNFTKAQTVAAAGSPATTNTAAPAPAAVETAAPAETTAPAERKVPLHAA